MMKFFETNLGQEAYMHLDGKSKLNVHRVMSYTNSEGFTPDAIKVILCNVIERYAYATEQIVAKHYYLVQIPTSLVEEDNLKDPSYENRLQVVFVNQVNYSEVDDEEVFPFDDYIEISHERAAALYCSKSDDINWEEEESLRPEFEDYLTSTGRASRNYRQHHDNYYDHDHDRDSMAEYYDVWNDDRDSDDQEAFYQQF